MSYFIIALVIIVGLIIIYYILKKRSYIRENNEFITLVFTVIEIMVAVIGASLGTSEIITNNYYNRITSMETQIGELEAQISIINNNISSTINNDNSQMFFNSSAIETSMNQDELLDYAYNAYHGKDYETVIRCYSFSKISNFPVVNYNLAYMHANGVYFEQDLQIANYYAQKALEQGYEPAYGLKLYILLELNIEVDIKESIYELVQGANNKYIKEYFESIFFELNQIDDLYNFYERLNSLCYYEERVNMYVGGSPGSYSKKYRYDNCSYVANYDSVNNKSIYGYYCDLVTTYVANSELLNIGFQNK